MRLLSPTKKHVLTLALACTAVGVQAQSVYFSWADQLGGTGYDYATSIAVDNLGNVYTTGEFRGTVDFDPGTGTTSLTSSGADDVFISKLDANGSLVWAFKIGGTGSDIGNDIGVDAYGNVYVAGVFESTVDFDPGAGTANLTSTTATTSSFLVKLRSSGAYAWSNMITSNLGTTTNSVSIDANGTSHLAGDFTGTADLDPSSSTATAITAGQTDVYIVEMDSGGVYQWSKWFGGNSYDHCAAIAEDPSGNLFLTGYFTSTCDFEPGSGVTNLTAASTDIFVSSLTSNGNLTWVKQMGGSGSDGGTSIVVNATGEVFSAGYFDGTADFDPGAGTVLFSASTGISDAFVSKLTANGTYSWAAQLGGTSVDAAQAITLDVQGNVYTTGRFSGTADFDPSASTGSLVSAGTYDIFVSKLNSSGAYVWAHKMGGAANDVGNSVCIDASDNVHTAGYFAGTADFDPQASSWTYTTAALDDIFISKWSQSGVGIVENVPSAIQAFPNPTDGLVTFTSTAILDNATVNVFSLNGQLQLSQQHSGNTSNLDFSNLAAGVYFVEILIGESVSRIRVIKQ